MVISQMRLKKYFLLATFALITLFPAQQIKEIPLQYSTSGYAENQGASVSARKVIPIDNSAITPSVKAEMNVSESGSLTYILPIEVLKGLNSFQPNIALAYNSQGGNGQAGWGWNIIGLSTITRGGKSKEIDGLTIGSQFDNTDPYYLDGQRLLKINETTFATEKFSKVKISKPTSGEFQFVIQYPDGKIARYKELVTGQFYISSFTDSFNNEVHYSYQAENNVPVVTKISYGGTSSANDKFYINFTYKARQRNIQVFRKGVSYVTSKVLSEISIGSLYTPLYRKYTLSHDFVEDNNVERLRTILVNNESGESLKPLNFNYNTSSQGAIKINDGTVQSTLAKNATGLGSLVMGNFLYSETDKMQPVFQERLTSGYNIKVGAGETATYVSNISTNNSGTLLFSGKVLDFNNKITERDQLIVVNEMYVGGADDTATGQTLKDDIHFEIKNLVTGEQRKVIVQVKGGMIEVQNYIPPDPYDNYRDGTYETTYTRDETRREYIQGDFNNDGLVDFLVIEPKNYTRGNRLYWVEIGKQNSGPTVQATPVILNEGLNFYGKEIYPIEFDGDGLPELLVVDKYTSKYSVYKINFSNNTINALVSDGDLSNFGNKTPIFLGDFNGDGLTDFITPQVVYEIPEDDNAGLKLGDTYYRMQTETLLWWKYTGNGVSFVKNQEDYTEQKIAYLKPSQSNYIKRSTFWQKFWNGTPDEYQYTRYSTHNIIITDFNNDGRSDIVTLNKIGKAKYNSSGSLAGVSVDNLSNLLTRRSAPLVFQDFVSEVTNRINFYENKTLKGGTFQKLSSLPLDGNRISPLSLILSTQKFDYLNTSQSGVYIYDPLIGASMDITIDNSNFLEKQIQEVNNGTDVLQKVEYRNMVPKDKYFSKDHTEVTYLYKPQGDLRYPYYVHSKNPALYLVGKIHTVFDGKILTKEYRYENGIQHLEGKGFMGFQKTYSSDAYESEIKNGKYSNKNPVNAVFWNIITRDPEKDNVVMSSTYGGINKFFTENLTVNKKFDKGNHQYLFLATDEISIDNLKKVTVRKKYVYDEADDLKLKTAYTDFGGVGSSTSNYTYKPEFANGEHYFYGKIASIENIVSKDGLSFTTRDESDYFPNGNVSQARKYGNKPGAPPIVTSFTYDNIGNIKTQTLSAVGVASQTITYDYETTGRYINKTTAPDGLYSAAVVDAVGRTSSEVSSLGHTTSYIYDSWGNITEITDFLGKKTTISKSSVSDASTGGVYNIHKKREGGVETIVTFDKFDREIQAMTQAIKGKWVVTKIGYDIFGRKIKFSEPFYEGEPVRWNFIEYDELNRPVKNRDFKGYEITTCYEGLKVTVDDGVSKKTSKTLDAMGHTIRQQDHGGVINYYYYPNGEVKETNYEGIKTTFEIDGWGNKTKMADPSAGTFTYEYDALSRITKEVTPKGYTLYSYDDLGRPITENTYGNTPAENTNIEKTYTYNGQTKLPETITGVNNGQKFTYTTYYDQYFRVKGKKEETPDFTYTSSTTFDAVGRVDLISMSTILTNSNNYTSNSTVKNVYDDNGILIQQNDSNSGAMIWHLSDINARGQVKQTEYGNGYTLINQYYDLDYSLFNIRHQNTNNGNIALDMDYNQNSSRGILNFRRNNIFGKKEDFTYDLLNRLLTEAVNGVIINQYTYDKRGRITSNTELGKYNYNETDYKLQGIDFNTNGQNVNTQRGFATIKYNAFKSPIQITLVGKEDLNFEYNILKTRYSMKSSVTGQQKLYSSDFAIEITKESNGKTQLITYITGDPYSANYIKKEILNGGALIENSNYYLHRDNIGSILAISKTDGSVVEKRFFDAWGNLKGIVNAAGQMITDPVAISNYTLFLDRGYTGHEHLWKTGLINMNARLYDPVLRRFLSPDNLVQDPFNTQSYNRFGYVFNNPLLYVDIDGNEFASIGVAIIIGVAVAVTTKAIMNMISGIPVWYGMGKAAVMGGISGAISFGIGSAATSLFGQILTVGKALFEAGAHALTSGAMSAIDGGKFETGALTGAISSLIASGVQSLGINFGASTNTKTVYNTFGRDYMKASMLVMGGLSGGISSTIAGGNFWDGFKQGIITSGLNHLSHLVTEENGDNSKTLADYKDEIEKTIDKRMTKISSKLDKNKGSVEEINSMKEQFSLLKEAKSMLSFLLSKENGLNISVSKVAGVYKNFHVINGSVSWGDNNKSFILNYDGTVGTLIHEMVHIYQAASGSIETGPFSPGSTVSFYNSTLAETWAWKIEFSLFGFISPYTWHLSEINEKFLESRGY